MSGRSLVLPALLAIPLVTLGCATKKFVREEIGRSEAKTEQSLGRIDGELGQAKTRVTGLETEATEATRRADQARGVSNEAALKADQAVGRADQAVQTASRALVKAEQTDTRLTRLWANRNKRTLADTVVIKFGFDRWQLDDRGETGLLDVVKQLQENPELFVELEGYTDNVGAGPYNLQLSQQRVEAVRRFLVQKGIELHRVQSIGLGDVRPMADNRTKEGREQNRRVALKLLVPAAD